MAKPFHWTPEIEEEIFQNIAAGKPIRAALEDDWLPGWTTFNKRLADDADFAARYARAREVQADKLFAECLEIADQYDQAEEKLEGGTDHINRAKLRIDTRKWMAGKLRPKVYGDKAAVDHTSSDGSMSPKGLDLSGLTDEELALLKKLAEKSA